MVKCLFPIRRKILDCFAIILMLMLLYENNNINWQGNLGEKMALLMRKNILGQSTASLDKRQLNKDM